MVAGRNPKKLDSKTIRTLNLTTETYVNPSFKTKKVWKTNFIPNEVLESVHMEKMIEMKAFKGKLGA